MHNSLGMNKLNPIPGVVMFLTHIHICFSAWYFLHLNWPEISLATDVPNNVNCSLVYYEDIILKPDVRLKPCVSLLHFYLDSV